jgi:hypothetical protein
MSVIIDKKIQELIDISKLKNITILNLDDFNPIIHTGINFNVDIECNNCQDNKNLTLKYFRNEFIKSSCKCVAAIQQLNDIAKLKNITILNLDEFDPSIHKNNSGFELDIECNNCETTKSIGLKDFRAKRFLERQCKCITTANKQEKLYKKLKIEKDKVQIDNNSQSEKWKFIHEIDINLLTKKYKIPSIFAQYKISNEGKIVNIATGKELNQYGKPYKSVSLKIKGKKGKKSRNRHFLVHVLVACAFVQIPDLNDEELKKLSVDHMNRTCSNNDFKNFRWATEREQKLNRILINNGCLWISKNNIYFNEEDYKKYGQNETEIQIFPYSNRHEKLSIENEINFDNEIWETIEYNDIEFCVSSQGRVVYENGQCGFGSLNVKGYMQYKHVTMHRIIGKAFLKKELEEKRKLNNLFESQIYINHKSGRKCNNKLSNLEQTTTKENSDHAVEMGFIKSIKVLQYDLNYNFIKKFNSINKIVMELNITYRRVKNYIEANKIKEKDDDFSSFKNFILIEETNLINHPILKKPPINDQKFDGSEDDEFEDYDFEDEKFENEEFEDDSNDEDSSNESDINELNNEEIISEIKCVKKKINFKPKLIEPVIIQQQISLIKLDQNINVSRSASSMDSQSHEEVITPIITNLEIKPIKKKKFIFKLKPKTNI